MFLSLSLFFSFSSYFTLLLLWLWFSNSWKTFLTDYILKIYNKHRFFFVDFHFFSSVHCGCNYLKKNAKKRKKCALELFNFLFIVKISFFPASTHLSLVFYHQVYATQKNKFFFNSKTMKSSKVHCVVFIEQWLQFYQQNAFTSTRMTQPFQNKETENEKIENFPISLFLVIVLLFLLFNVSKQLRQRILKSNSNFRMLFICAELSKWAIQVTQKGKKH